ncbi:Uncharacterised protein [Segatella copri]|nr:Uncharacterised protein [Segatella copri]
MNSVCLLVCDIQSPIVEFYCTLCRSICCLVYNCFCSRISNRHLRYTTLYINCCGTSSCLCFFLGRINMFFINSNQSCW